MSCVTGGHNQLKMATMIDEKYVTSLKKRMHKDSFTRFESYLKTLQMLWHICPLTTTIVHELDELPQDPFAKETFQRYDDLMVEGNGKKAIQMISTFAAKMKDCYALAYIYLCRARGTVLLKALMAYLTYEDEELNASLNIFLPWKKIDLSCLRVFDVTFNKFKSYNSFIHVPGFVPLSKGKGKEYGVEELLNLSFLSGFKQIKIKMSSCTTAMYKCTSSDTAIIIYPSYCDMLVFKDAEEQMKSSEKMDITVIWREEAPYMFPVLPDMDIFS